MIEKITHSHPDGQYLRSHSDYELAVVCPWCGAETGSPCDRKKASPRTGTHAGRSDRASARRRQDESRAPLWPEDRTPGVCYSTLPGCKP